MARIGTLALVPAVQRATHRVGLYLLDRRPRLRVTQAEAHILAHLCRDSPCRIADLQASFGHRRSTLTSILDRLVERDFIRRENHPEDRRAVLVTLTASGRTVAHRVHEVLMRLEGIASSRVTKAELAAFWKVVRALEAAAAASEVAHPGRRLRQRVNSRNARRSRRTYGDH